MVKAPANIFSGVFSELTPLKVGSGAAFSFGTEKFRDGRKPIEEVSEFKSFEIEGVLEADALKLPKVEIAADAFKAGTGRMFASDELKVGIGAMFAVGSLKARIGAMLTDTGKLCAGNTDFCGVGGVT